MYYILKNGEPHQTTDIMVWGQWMEHANRKLALDVIDDVRISTVFLGLDHSFGREGPPMLWETMTFAPLIHELDGKQARYRSREAALKGHADMVALVHRTLYPHGVPTRRIDLEGQ